MRKNTTLDIQIKHITFRREYGFIGKRKHESNHDRLKNGFEEAMTRAKDMKLKIFTKSRAVG